jgi:hypothetical protein
MDMRRSGILLRVNGTKMTKLLQMPTPALPLGHAEICDERGELFAVVLVYDREHEADTGAIRRIAEKAKTAYMSNLEATGG